MQGTQEKSKKWQANTYIMQSKKNNSKKHIEKGITLIALVVTMVLHYDKVKKCSNSNSFLLSSI